MIRLTHMLFVGDTIAGEVRPDDLNVYPAEDLVALPDDYWQPGRFYAWEGRTAVPTDPPRVVQSLSRIAYQRLFTQAERIAIRASTDPIVVDFRELAALAETIDLDDADVIAGTQYLESLDLIGSGRAAAILSGQPPA